MAVPPFFRLFRPSRPDSIETRSGQHRRQARGVVLFRPSRPDSIETRRGPAVGAGAAHCSGLLGRTPLRPYIQKTGHRIYAELFRPSRPDSIETFPGLFGPLVAAVDCSGLLDWISLRLSGRVGCLFSRRGLFWLSGLDLVDDLNRRSPGKPDWAILSRLRFPRRFLCEI